MACVHFQMVLIASGTHWAKESNHRSFQKTTENGLHSLGKRTLLRSELHLEAQGIKIVKTEFLKPIFYV